MDRIWSLQYLRAAAAMGVVMRHVGETAGPNNFAIGGAGVDVFFVISGFIMASLTFGKESSPGLFLWRRAIRIVPLYWLATLAMAAIMFVKPNFIWNSDNSANNLVLSLLFIPHAPASPGQFTPVLAPGWTLEFEVFFYLLCTLALFLPGRRRLLILAAVIVALVAIGAALQTKPISWGIYTDFLLLEFAAGIGLAVAWRNKLTIGRKAGLIAVVAGVSAYVLMHFGVISGVGIRVIDWGVPALLIVAGALGIEAGGWAPRSKAFAFLGDASYSLYLTHALVVNILAWVLPGLAFWQFAVMCLAGSVIVAGLSYQFLERPLTNALKSAWKGPAPRTALDTAQG